ncbi:MAG TPA: hypothetical protein VFM93_12505 [Candidatus Limnocylindria bacterium]|nr:hypothetical protein [Candidatus Limnocylindria bacterium]
MRPPYPVDLVPLLPQFLTRRRTKLDHVLRMSDELGLDRLAYLVGVNLRQFPGGATLDDILGPYVTKRDLRDAALAAAEGAGLIQRRGDRWTQTAKGRDHAARLRRAAHEHFATLRTIDDGDLRRLAGLLERAFETVAAAPAPAHERLPRVRAVRADGAPPNALAALEDAVNALWLMRDDCHVAAWRDAGFDGPRVDVLTRIWRDEAKTVEELASKVPQGPEDVRAQVDLLRRDRLVERDAPLRLTAEGTRVRQRIEDETDRYFFTPWPDEVGRDAAWLADRLSAVNAALA